MRIFDEWRWFLMAHLERSAKVMNILNLTSEIFNFHEAFPSTSFHDLHLCSTEKVVPGEMQKFITKSKKRKNRVFHCCWIISKNIKGIFLHLHLN